MTARGIRWAEESHAARAHGEFSRETSSHFPPGDLIAQTKTATFPFSLLPFRSQEHSVSFDSVSERDLAASRRVPQRPGSLLGPGSCARFLVKYAALCLAG